MSLEWWMNVHNILNGFFDDAHKILDIAWNGRSFLCHNINYDDQHKIACGKYKKEKSFWMILCISFHLNENKQVDSWF